ncbi:hypothetical protein LshimejAT787_1400490 [Lyophyllum shimeji]|uniref:Uncharacterized protein n=1 Tax=Lyophyllum shimeji TaxID=47721 RepID=A0A9P3PV82_LYOSH|nr:hypothetical protein LshimejAT787_1400490 [Lyophyllum shimeji]
MEDYRNVQSTSYYTRPQPLIQAGQHAPTQKARAEQRLSINTAIWSPRPFRRRVFSTRSLASAWPEAGSSGRSLILVSVGSPAQLRQLPIGIERRKPALALPFSVVIPPWEYPA